jgi:adenosine deaminase
MLRKQIDRHSMRFSYLIAMLCALTLSTVAAYGQGDPAARLAEYRSSPPLLRAFLYRMPKGGDLHNHLSGAAYAEATIRAGAGAGLCVEPQTAQVSPPPCVEPRRSFADAVHDTTLNRAIVDSWSMRDFIPSSGLSGHDHFFAAFGRFGGAATMGDMAAEVVDRAARQRMRYVELMVTLQGTAVGTLADSVAQSQPWNGDDPAAFEAALRSSGIENLVAQASKDIDAIEQRVHDVLHCGTPQARPGCGMTVRWLQQVSRTMPPARVFAAALFGAILNRDEPRVVGLDFVAPEDDPVALADYTAQMKMLDYLHARLPQTKISLHAGELTLGLVRPEDLLFHIRQAVELGHANRIGHGVDVMYEDDPFGLLQEMARQRVAVEINLTSNAQILGVRGTAHPFPIYRAAGVPTVLSTDDEGVERVDRTNELQLAVTTYNLNWPTLVALERNTLEYAFVAGSSLWVNPKTWQKVSPCAAANVTHDPPPPCASFLHDSEKARLQWSLEHDLANFNQEARQLRLRPS